MMKLLLLATAATGTYALRAPTSMSVAVFGATGLTGRECTHQLLERGVPVRALCRDPSKLLTPLGSTGKEDLVENDQLYNNINEYLNILQSIQLPFAMLPACGGPGCCCCGVWRPSYRVPATATIDQTTRCPGQPLLFAGGRDACFGCRSLTSSMLRKQASRHVDARACRVGTSRAAPRRLRDTSRDTRGRRGPGPTRHPLAPQPRPGTARARRSTQS